MLPLRILWMAPTIIKSWFENLPNGARKYLTMEAFFLAIVITVVVVIVVDFATAAVGVVKSCNGDDITWEKRCWGQVVRPLPRWEKPCSVSLLRWKTCEKLLSSKYKNDCCTYNDTVGIHLFQIALYDIVRYDDHMVLIGMTMGSCFIHSRLQYNAIVYFYKLDTHFSSVNKYKIAHFCR